MHHSIPSLLQLCVSSAASTYAWRLQRRAVEQLPEHAADALLEQLLAQGRLDRSLQLELFRHSVTCVRVVPGPGAGQQLRTGAGPPSATRLVDASFLAYISEFSHLSDVTLDGCPKLRDTHLTRLTARTSTLRSLRLPRCAGLTATCITETISQLSCLNTLDLTETGVRSPAGRELSSLPAGLTQLHLGGLPGLSDACCADGLPHLADLRTLSLWNTGVGLSTLELLSVCCSKLSSLDVSWAHVDVLPALPSLTTLNVQHCTIRDVWWPGGGPTQEQLIAMLPAVAASSPPTSGSHSSSRRTASAAGTRFPSLLPLTHLNLSSCTLAGGAGTAPAVCQALACAAPTLMSLDMSNSPGLILSHPGQHPPLSPGDGLTSAAVLLAACTALTSLNLSGASWLQAQDAAGLVLGPGSSGTLRVLKLAGCSGLCEEGAQQLGCLHTLQDLDVSRCDFGDAEVRWLCQLTQLTNLVLDGNLRLRGELTPPAASTLAAEPDRPGRDDNAGADLATGAELPAAAPRDEMAAVWQPAPQLGETPQAVQRAEMCGVAASARGATATASVSSGWGAFRALRSLSLCGTDLRLAGNRQLADGLGRTLTHLWLGSRGISDKALQELAQRMTVLEVLELRNCIKVTARGVLHLAVMPALTRLRASGSWLAAEAGAWQQLLSVSASLHEVEADGRSWCRGAQQSAESGSGAVLSRQERLPAPHPRNELLDDQIRYSSASLRGMADALNMAMVEQWREENAALLGPDLLTPRQ